jgi:DNA-binding MarR family transcriptional regulator
VSDRRSTRSDQRSANEGSGQPKNCLKSERSNLKKAVISAEAHLAQTGETAPAKVNIDGCLIRRMLRARRSREQQFGPNLFADPAWDILLEAYAAELEQQRISVTALSEASAVPPTTALRWLSKLEEDGWLRRKADPYDGRRFWVALTEQASVQLRTYFDNVEPGLFLV